MSSFDDSEAKKQFINYRDKLLQILAKNSENYDKSILSLSSAILAITLILIKDVININEALYLWELKAAWALLILSIVLTISSYITGRFAIEKQLKNAEKYYLQGQHAYLTKINIWKPFTKTINMASGFSFIFAIIFLVCFVSTNIKEYNMSEGNQKQAPIDNRTTIPDIKKESIVDYPNMEPTNQSPKDNKPDSNTITNPSDVKSEK